MNKRIFVTREIPEQGLTILRQKGFNVDVWSKKKAPSQKDLISCLKKTPYDAVLCLLTDTINADVFNAAPSVKIFANYADGYNNIDIEEAKKRNITITNTPGVASRAVAEHAIALMCALTTRIVEADTFVRKGKYTGWTPMNFIGTDLYGKKLGLIGGGNIGSEVARMASLGFGMSIVYYDLVENTELEKTYGAVRIQNIEDLLKQADIVSLHVPLLPSTHHLITKERLALMKSSALLVNTSRGPVIDEQALVSALKNKAIGGAGLDVFEFEPKLSKGLAKLSNVVLTPHIASARESVRNQMAIIAANNIVDVLENKIPANKIV